MVFTNFYFKYILKEALNFFLINSFEIKIQIPKTVKNIVESSFIRSLRIIIIVYAN